MSAASPKVKGREEFILTLNCTLYVLASNSDFKSNPSYQPGTEIPTREWTDSLAVPSQQNWSFRNLWLNSAPLDPTAQVAKDFELAGVRMRTDPGDINTPRSRASSKEPKLFALDAGVINSLLQSNSSARAHANASGMIHADLEFIHFGGDGTDPQLADPYRVVPRWPNEPAAKKSLVWRRGFMAAVAKPKAAAAASVASASAAGDHKQQPGAALKSKTTTTTTTTASETIAPIPGAPGGPPQLFDSVGNEGRSGGEPDPSSSPPQPAVVVQVQVVNPVPLDSEQSVMVDPESIRASVLAEHQRERLLAPFQSEGDGAGAGAGAEGVPRVPREGGRGGRAARDIRAANNQPAANRRLQLSVVLAVVSWIALTVWSAVLFGQFEEVNANCVHRRDQVCSMQYAVLSVTVSLTRAFVCLLCAAAL